MSSILTNSSAIVALQTLKGTNAGLAKAQSEISTGKSIANAKDNAAIWAIAQIMDTDVSSFQSIQSQLNVADATVATSRAGAERISGLLKEMKNLAVGGSSDTADFAKIDTDIQAKMTEINDIISATQMNGINLLATDVDGNGGTDFSVISSLNRSGAGGTTTMVSIDVTGQDLEAALTAGVTAITDAATAATALGEIEGYLNTVVDAAAELGSFGKRIANQSDFMGLLADSLKLGIGSLVDANMEEASARLQALQTQQQLGIQSLSIANQAPQSILALFRG
ncbi:flagellin N-terminal helical domain-containing protein [Paracoccus zhejiangensis]|uniref:Flagellin n=1 Tax=Paracoccus zhejiangensis TaxID=1077935 RepID=A0A2H5EZQ2_9RHOB|nr:flagellin [Paracoccus zhejiangensis]AUH64776.1 flagellin [Paracoccus zhejiangensis]